MVIGKCNTKLSFVIDAGNIAAGRLDFAQNRQKHPGKNGDDGNDYQKFNQRESRSSEDAKV